MLIPAFAIGRVEELLYWLFKLQDEKKLPSMPIYVDSPMALKALEFYRNRAAELDPGMASMHRHVSRFRAVATAQESKVVTASSEPAIVIASSGMATGGRVVHHLFAGLPDARNTVLFVGFQAAGTRGRSLIEGARYIKMFGQEIPVKANIAKLNGMSAHADSGEILRWLRTFPTPPQQTYLVHGEIGPQETLKASIEKALGWAVAIPVQGQRVEVPL